jgi:NADPH:quinone reductase-like Zn-dependent oxidoreductase
MPRAVKFDRYGGIDVLRVVEVDRPVPGPKQVLIRMTAAGINPGEAMIREGAFAKQWPATFPSGQGSDLAGVVEAVGSGSETSGCATRSSDSRTIGRVTLNWLLSRLTM